MDESTADSIINPKEGVESFRLFIFYNGSKIRVGA